MDEDDGQVVVKTSSGHELRAKDVVVATNSPINDRVVLHTKQAPYRTYVIAAKLPRGGLLRVNSGDRRSTANHRDLIGYREHLIELVRDE